MTEEFEDIDFEEDNSLIALDADNLTKYNQMLDFYLHNLQNTKAMYVVIDNCIELGDNIKNIKYGYVEEMVPLLRKSLELLTKLAPQVEDKTLRELLKENYQQIRSFFERFSIPFYEDEHPEGKERTLVQTILDPYDSQDSDFRAKVRSMAKEVRDRHGNELSEEWRKLSDQLTKEYAEVSKDPAPELDLLISEGYKRFKQRQRELGGDKRLLELSKAQELELSANPILSFRENVLKPLAEQLLKENRR